MKVIEAISEKEIYLLLKKFEDKRENLPFNEKIKFMISDFRLDWELKEYYKKTWILNHINPYKVIRFLLLGRH